MRAGDQPTGLGPEPKNDECVLKKSAIILLVPALSPKRRGVLGGNG
jgi:hypothetical protein